MADIFGREPDDYQFVRALKEADAWERYVQQNASRRPGASPLHNFDALGTGVPPEYQRAAEDAQAVGYLTDNLLSLQTVADEVLYTAYRLPDFVHLNTSIPEGAQTYGIKVQRRVGQAQRITAPGFDAPSATVSQTIATQQMHWYGLDAEWSIDELRGAMMGGIALDTQSIEAAVTGTMETMEAVGLTGGDYDEKGLLNLATTGTDPVNRRSLSATFEASTALVIRDEINGELSKVIEKTKETFGRQINTGMSIYLPGTEYDLLTTKYIGDNADKTLMKSILDDNPWTHFSKQPLMIHRVLELAGQGTGTTGRMVIALKNSRVAEMGVSITPRVLRIMDKGRVVTAQVEAKFSPLFVKRPTSIYYVDVI